MTDDIPVPFDRKRAIIITLGIMMTVSLGVVALFATQSTPETSQLPTAIVQLFPPQDQVVLTQAQIGVQLDPDWTGELSLDGEALPLDEYEPNGLDAGYIFWRPGPDKTIREMEHGVRTLTIQYWPKDQGPASDEARSYSWTFKAA